MDNHHLRFLIRQIVFTWNAFVLIVVNEVYIAEEDSCLNENFLYYYSILV